MNRMKTKVMIVSVVALLLAFRSIWITSAVYAQKTADKVTFVLDWTP